ncbi:MAG: FAD-dependent monooxygenase, partial [Chromatocurvus sp.]
LAPATPAIKNLLDQPGMHIGPGKMAVRYPLRGGSLLNLVFFVRQQGWTEDGWSITASADELCALFQDWCDDVRTLIRAAAPETLFKWAINAHRPLPNWSLGETVVLIGDAAHAMTPFLGQGAAAGIEDAVVLARALDLAASPGEALARYASARMERTRFIQAESNANADRLQGPESELYGLGNLRNEETLGLFAYDCVTATV